MKNTTLAIVLLSLMTAESYAGTMFLADTGVKCPRNDKEIPEAQSDEGFGGWLIEYDEYGSLVGYNNGATYCTVAENYGVRQGYSSYKVRCEGEGETWEENFSWNVNSGGRNKANPEIRIGYRDQVLVYPKACFGDPEMLP